MFESKAQKFQSVVYFESNGQVIIPPGNDVPPPDASYERKEANTLREVRALTKRLDAQASEKFYKHERQRLNVKRQSVSSNLEFALRAREKMSDPTAKAITDRAIARMKQQLDEGCRTFQPSGHFHFMEYDGLKQSG